MKVKGIGKKTAEAILNWRGQVGTIERMGQLDAVKGVGTATIRNLICYFYAEKEGPLPCEVAIIQHGVGPVNLNTATLKELDTLPGIGKKKAEAILRDRKETGFFRSVDELRRIKGFGKGMIAKLEGLVETRLDINQGRGAEFEALGFKNGDAIVKHREAAGRFAAVADLKQVPDIDADLVDKLADFLTVK